MRHCEKTTLVIARSVMYNYNISCRIITAFEENAFDYTLKSNNFLQKGAFLNKRALCNHNGCKVSIVFL